MDMEDDPQRAVLQPRRPGESIKVAETVLKRRERNLQAAAERAAQIAKARNQKKQFKKGGKLQIIRAERLIKDCRNRQADRRRLKNAGKKPLPKQMKGRVLAAIRNGRLGGSREAKQTLRSVGLGKRHTLVFLPNTEDTARQLRAAKPYAFWGIPTFKMVCNLIHKRAAFRDPEKPQERTALSDNTLIEKCLGDLGVLCTEDLAHAIHTRSDKFAQVNERLWPMMLGDAKKTTGKLVNDKYYTQGPVGADVNEKIAQLLGR
jgi:large subunit ribosomal protein L7e